MKVLSFVVEETNYLCVSRTWIKQSCRGFHSMSWGSLKQTQEKGAYENVSVWFDFEKCYVLSEAASLVQVRRLTVGFPL